jgi:hypothetical protein
MTEMAPALLSPVPGARGVPEAGVHRAGAAAVEPVVWGSRSNERHSDPTAASAQPLAGVR